MTPDNQAVFADTGYWVALLNPRDGLYQKALLAGERFRSCRIITSELVLVEFLAAASGGGYGSRRLAVNTVKKLESNPDVDIVPMSTEQFGKALELYGTRLDHRWSLTDCASFVIMEQGEISQALAYDIDFVQAGFRALMREV